MALVTTTLASDVQAPVDYVLMRGLLRQAMKRLPYFHGTVPGELQKNQGSMSVKWRRWVDLTVVTTALGETASPPVFGLGRDSVAASAQDVTAAIAKYGKAITYNEEVDLFNVNTRASGFMNVLGRNAGESLNGLVATQYDGETTDIFSNGAATANVNTILAKNDIRFCVNQLQNNGAGTFVGMTQGGRNINTTPVREAYYGFCHVDVEEDIREMTGFVPVEQYAGQTRTLLGEFGTIAGVRFLSTQSAPVSLGGGATGGTTVNETTNAADVYTTVIIGEEAMGTVGLGEQHTREIYEIGEMPATVEIINHPPGSSGIADHFNEVGSMAWKAWFVAKVLNSNFVMKIESAATDLSA